nr:hypothetical protein [Tanacetum cinerariifolium]
MSACKATTQVQSRFTHNGGSILEVLDDMIMVGQFMGYEMEGYSNDIERIIGLQGVVGETKNTILKDLVEIDKNLDEGANPDKILPTRADLNCKLYEINQMDLKDVAQKAK